MARPRSDEARRKALDAARELILDKGVVNLTIEDVAAVSGVAKTTIYRHWPERTALIVDTVNAMFEHLRTPDTGSLRGDLEAFFGAGDAHRPVGQRRPDHAGHHRGRRTAIRRWPTCSNDWAANGSGCAGRSSSGPWSAARSVPEVAALGLEVLIGVTVGPIVFQKIVRRRKLTTEYVNACLDIVGRRLDRELTPSR